MRLPGILAEAFRGQMTILRSVGTSQERIDAFAKVRGEHRFPSDHALPGMLYAGGQSNSAACPASFN
jgi:hypothetical protein